MDKELLILHGARYATIQLSHDTFLKDLEDGTTQAVEYTEIINYLSSKINEYKINHGLNYIDEINSANYKNKLKSEYHQLVFRYNELKTMLEKWENGTLDFQPKCPKDVYEKQLSAMRQYFFVLAHRMKAENLITEED